MHPTCGPTQDDDIPGAVRFRTYEVLRGCLGDRYRWAYLPYSMHMAGPREALQHMILRKVPPPPLPILHLVFLAGTPSRCPPLRGR